MRFTPTTGRLVRAGGVMTALLLTSFVSCAQTAAAAPAWASGPTPPGGGGITNPQPCEPDLQPCGPTDPCDGEMPPEDCPPPVCDDGQEPVDGECPPPPDPCDTETPPADCPPPECEDGGMPVDGECPRPDPCEVAQPPEDCGTDGHEPDPDPGDHGTVDQPVPGTPSFTG
jgi:hypothetical protein